MSEVESTMDQTESNDPLWQVQLASGQVCRMTLELLDDAFQDGLINEQTLVMQDGTSEWLTLGALLGLDSDGEAEASGTDPSSDTLVAAAEVTTPDATMPDAVTAPFQVPVQPAAEIAPVAQVAAPVQAQPSAYVDPFAPPIQVAQPAPVQVQAQVQPAQPAAFYDPFAPPMAAPTRQIVPPASAQANPFALQAAAQAAPSFAPQVSFSPPEPLTRSTAPVAADVDFDLEAVNFGKKRSPAKWIIGIAAVLGGVGFAAMNMNTTTETIPPAVAAPAAPPAYETTPSAPAVRDEPAVVNTKPAMSDDAKKALLDADKTRAAKMQQQRQAQPSRGGGAAPSGPRKKSGDPFHKGGDKYDPLNASL
jgi:hypothetical protein